MEYLPRTPEQLEVDVGRLAVRVLQLEYATEVLLRQTEDRDRRLGDVESFVRNARAKEEARRVDIQGLFEARKAALRKKVATERRVKVAGRPHKPPRGGR